VGGLPVQFLQNPQAVQPGSLMPQLGVTRTEARHIAAFLYTLQ
jgi:cytochrome c